MTLAHLKRDRQWTKWSPEARAVFLEVYQLHRSQDLINPMAIRLPPPDWHTIAWNFAWMAADATQQAIHDGLPRVKDRPGKARAA